MTVIKRSIVEIDVMKLDKAKFREWKKNDGTSAKFCSMDIIYTDKQEPVKKKDGSLVQGGGKTLHNVGFVVQSKLNKDEPNGDIIGNVKEWIEDKVEEQPAPKEEVIEYPSDEINPDDVPF